MPMAFIIGSCGPQRSEVENAQYDIYFGVLNEITSAYYTLRNSYARKRYGHDYERCSTEERETVRAFYPQRITESFYGKEEGGLQ